jgi:hypothetical protein
MVAVTEVEMSAAVGWVIDVMPNSGRPVTNWLVVGPYFDSGSLTDGQGAMESMFHSEDEALIHARGLAEDWPHHVRVVVFPPDPIA